MKIILFFLVSISSPLLMASEELSIQFNNGLVEFSADIIEAESGDGFYVKNVSMKVPSESHGTLYLVAEFGWGDSPYNFLCEEMSQSLYGSDKYKYASAYGFATDFGVLSGFFSKPEFLIVNRDQSFSLSDSYPNAVYDSGFACYDKKYEY